MLRYTRRLVEPLCRAALAQRKVLVLIGARQTGKSTLTRALLADVPDAEKLLLNLDDPFLRDRLVNEEGAVVRMIERHAGRPWAEVPNFHLVVDEAQRAPALFPILKALYDAHRDRLGLILTGSSALQIHDPVAESFAGRARIIAVHPFTLAEGFAHARGTDPDADLPRRIEGLLRGTFTDTDFDEWVLRARRDEAERRQYTLQHLLKPLFPEPSDAEEPETWITDYLATYLEKDVASLAEVGNLALFRACLRQLAARVGSPLKWEPAAQEIGTSPVTLRKYAGLMEQTYAVVRLGSYAVNPVKRVVKAPKLYFADNGLLWGLRGFEDRGLLQATGQIGAYVESLVVGEVRRWCALEPTAPELSTWSKTAVSEVDVVVTNRGFTLPIEVKASERLDDRWQAGVDAFDADHLHLGVHAPTRLVVHLGEPARLGPRTYAIPLWAFT